MKQGKKLLWLLSVTLMISLYLINGAEAARLLDRIVAKVNNDVITLSELQEFMKAQEYMNPDVIKANTEDEKIAAYLELMIEDQLASQNAEQLDIQVSDAEVDSTIKYFISEQGMTPEQLKETLKAQDLTYEKYRTSIREQLQKTKLINSEIRSKINIEEREIVQYYKQHMQKGAGARPMVKLAQIYFSCPELAAGAECSEKKAKIDEAWQALQEGKDWLQVAAELSEGERKDRGGYLGNFQVAELNPIFRKIISDLDLGEYSRPFASSFGYHILKVLDISDSAPKTLEESREKIQTILFNEKFELHKTRWMNRLKEQAYIEVLF